MARVQVLRVGGRCGWLAGWGPHSVLDHGGWLMVIHFDQLDRGDEVCCDPGWPLKSGRVGRLEEGKPWVVEQRPGSWVGGSLWTGHKGIKLTP